MDTPISYPITSLDRPKASDTILKYMGEPAIA